MLSPNITTKSKPTACRYFSSCLPIANSGASPVPLSPITAKRTESLDTGRVIWFCSARPLTSSMRRQTAAARKCRLAFWHAIAQHVYDQVGGGVEQDEVASYDLVL